MERTEREEPQVTVEPGPLRALLRHCLRLPDRFINEHQRLLLLVFFAVDVLVTSVCYFSFLSSSIFPFLSVASSQS